MTYKKFTFGALLFLFAFSAWAECPSQIQCIDGDCQRIQIPSCNSPSNVKVIPSTTSSSGEVFQKEALAPNVTITPAGDIATRPSESNSVYATPCAENGSCYGDISNVTGLPKTTAVKGYYRKDGTYVRGHYRSRR